MSATKTKRMSREQLLQSIRDQRDWIEEHGGDLPGYIKRYGDPGVLRDNGKPMYGDGGTKIYEADTSALRKMEVEFESRFG